MKKNVVLSVAAVCVLSANESMVLPTIDVHEKANTKVVANVSGEALKSADLAEALMKQTPSVSIVRRSGIANDIILRGAKKDNINIILDNSKIYGACPNRMDPATSHVLTNNIESVEVIEGPFDVENFGTLSGLVKVNLKEPKEGFGGEVNVNYGSYSYQKYSASIHGGTEKFKFLLSASTEESDQYEDGNGDDFLAQQKKNGTPSGNQYKNENEDAYEKKTFMSKAIYNIDDSSEVAVSYTGNRSDNVLYPNTPMDADYDDSDIYTMSYTKRNLGQYSDELNLEYYYSRVDHPMSTRLRNNASMSKNRTNHMKSSILGAKVKNSLDIMDGYFTLGLDTSVRNWRGVMKDDTGDLFTSLTHTDTTNKAIFAKYDKDYGQLNIQYGARYDRTDIEAQDSSKKDNDYNFLSGNIFSTYHINDSSRVFFGVGVASRVPDARELYYRMSGNEDLNETQNREIDVGFEKSFESAVLKTKFFYSDLKDYIYFDDSNFQNVDASIYGLEVSGLYMFDDMFSMDAGLAYQRGEKDEALDGQTDKDLAEISPLRVNLGLNIENDTNQFRAEMVAADSWSNYDGDNGEEKLSGYAVFNLKYERAVTNAFDVTVGIDNVFDKTYATTNTYYDITYVETGGEPVVINEPGRYAYINLRYTF